MASKYSKLELPKFVNPDNSFQERVKDFMTQHQLERNTTGNLIKLYNDTLTELDQLEAKLSQLNLVKEAITQALLTVMDHEDINSVRANDGSLIYQQIEPYASVQDRTAYIEWIKQNNLENLMTVNWQTTNAMIKQRLLDPPDDGTEPIPPGCQVFMRTRLVRRRA